MIPVNEMIGRRFARQLVLLFALVCTPAQALTAFNWNILTYQGDDRTPDWEQRKAGLLAEIDAASPDVITLQEVYSSRQKQDVADHFAEYSWAYHAGEMTLWRKAGFTRKETAVVATHCLYVRLDKLGVMNCHYPYGHTDELNGVRNSISEVVARKLAGTKSRLIMLGDFNARKNADSVRYLYSPAGTVAGMHYPRGFRHLPRRPAVYPPETHGGIDHVLTTITGRVTVKGNRDFSDHPSMLFRQVDMAPVYALLLEAPE